jgi:hypothetical protein
VTAAGVQLGVLGLDKFFPAPGLLILPLLTLAFLIVVRHRFKRAVDFGAVDAIYKVRSRSSPTAEAGVRVRRGRAMQHANGMSTPEKTLNGVEQLLWSGVHKERESYSLLLDADDEAAQRRSGDSASSDRSGAGAAAAGGGSGIRRDGAAPPASPRGAAAIGGSAATASFLGHPYCQRERRPLEHVKGAVGHDTARLIQEEIIAN